MIQRRSFLAGLASMLAAPAIVHAGNLMPVKKIAYYELNEASLEDFLVELSQYRYPLASWRGLWGRHETT